MNPDDKPLELFDFHAAWESAKVCANTAAHKIARANDVINIPINGVVPVVHDDTHAAPGKNPLQP